MTVEHLLATISSSELSGWAAYFQNREEDRQQQVLETDALAGADHIRHELRGR